MTKVPPRDTNPASLHRREVLRRGAVLGGATLWASPVIQTIGMRAAAAQGGTTVAGVCPSHLDLKVRCGGEIHCLKFPESDFSCGASPPTAETLFVGHPAHGAGGSAHALDVSDCGSGIPPNITASSIDGGVTWAVGIPSGCEVLQAVTVGCTGGAAVPVALPNPAIGPLTLVFSCS